MSTRNITEEVGLLLYDSNASAYNISKQYIPFGPPMYHYPKIVINLDNAKVLMDEFGKPCVFSVGVFFNILGIILIMKTELRRVSALIYLVSLLLVDTVYLITVMVPWASKRVKDVYNINGICQIVYYCHYLTTFLEWWYMVLLLLERSLVLYSSKKSAKWCNLFRTKCMIITVSIFAIVAHLYLTWTSAVIVHGNYEICMVIPENVDDIMILQKIDSIFSFIIPSFLMTVLMCFVSYRLVAGTTRSQSQLRNCQNASIIIRRRSSPCQIKVNCKKIILKKFNAKDMTESPRLTIICLVIALVFLLLCLPHDILKARLNLLYGAHEVSLEERLWLSVFQEIYTINFAYKGLFCLICVKEFRSAFMTFCKLFLRSICQKPKEVDEPPHTDV